MSQTDGISVKIGDPSQTSSSNKMLSRQRSVHVPKKGRSASLNQGQSADTEHDEDKDIVSEDSKSLYGSFTCPPPPSFPPYISTAAIAWMK